MRRALFVGRFQPFHSGHLTVLERMRRDGIEEIVIVIGSAQYSHTKGDPFTINERKEIVESVLKDIGVKYSIVAINDVNSDSIWMSNVKRLTPKFDIIYANGSIKKLFENEGYRVIKTLMERDEARISGGKVRDMIAVGDEDWKKMVPDQVREKILEFNGVKRIKELYSQ